MNSLDELRLLAQLLEHEWNGRVIDRSQARDLAARLAPQHPELCHSLASVCRRMTQG